MERYFDIIAPQYESQGAMEALELGLFDIEHQKLDLDQILFAEPYANSDDGALDIIRIEMTDRRVFHVLDRWVDIRLILNDILPN